MADDGRHRHRRRDRRAGRRSADRRADRAPALRSRLRRRSLRRRRDARARSSATPRTPPSRRDARGAPRAGAALRAGGLRFGPAGRRGALGWSGVDELAYAGNHGLELLAPGAEEAILDPAIEEGGRAVRRVRARARGRTPWAPPGCGSRTRGRSRRFTGVGPSTRRPPSDGRGEIADRGPESAGLEPHWGRKVLEIRPASGIDKGTAVERLLARSADRAGAVRRRRPHRPRRLPGAALAGRRGRAARRGLHRHRLRRGARRSSPSRRTRSSPAPRGSLGC